MTKFIYLILFISLAMVANGQTMGNAPVFKNIDEIKLMPMSMDKIMHLSRYVRGPKMMYSEELNKQLDEALAYAKLQSKDDISPNILSAKAIVAMSIGDAPTAIDLIKKAEAYFPKLTEQQILALLSDFTRVHTRLGNIEQTIFYYDKMEAISKDKPQFIMQRVMNLRNRTNLDVRSRNIEKINANYQLALQLSRESGNPNLVKDTRFAYATALMNVQKEKEAFAILQDLIPDLDNFTTDRTGRFFEILSRNYELSGDYKNAFLWAEKLFNLPIATNQQKSNSINRMILMSFLLKNNANFDFYFAEHKKYGFDVNSLHSHKQYLLAESRYYDSKNNFAAAKESYLKTLNLTSARETATAFNFQALVALSELYMRYGKADSAAIYLQRADKLHKKTPVSPALRLTYASALKNYQQVNPVPTDTLLNTLKQELALKDTLYQRNLNKVTQALETRYRVGEKDKELQLAKQEQQLQVLELQKEKQRKWIVMIVATAIILTSAILIFFLWQRKKQTALLHAATVNGLKKQHDLDIMNTLSEAQENERKRVAERLHDEVGAMLSIAKLNISTLQENVYVSGNDFTAKLETTQSLMNNISETVRTISHTLMPIAIEKYGFKAAVMDLIATIKSSEKLMVEYVIEGFENTQKWPQSFTLTSYRMIQEVINNAIKHAEASHLFVQLIELPDAITILVEDNGKGFNPKELSEAGFGLKLLQTNILHLDGKLAIEGKPHQGTFILIELPLPHLIAT